MIKTAMIIFVSILIGSPLKLKDNQDNVTYLAGSDFKRWYLYRETPEDSHATCRASHPIASDNTYIFYTDGTFEFDHGAQTEDSNCKTGCCSDLVNLTGLWEFTNNGNGLKITASREKNNSANVLTDELFNASVDQLDQDTLIISQVNLATNIRYTFEFRRR